MPRLLAFILALPVFFGTFLVPAHAAKTATRTTAAQRATAPTDAQIDATIRTKLAKSKIGKDGFKFHVAHGVVTWEGATNVMQHKGAATRMARTAGAAQVINNIQVSSAAKEKAASNLKKAQVVQ